MTYDVWTLKIWWNCITSRVRWFPIILVAGLVWMNYYLPRVGCQVHAILLPIFLSSPLFYSFHICPSLILSIYSFIFMNKQTFIVKKWKNTWPMAIGDRLVNINFGSNWCWPLTCRVSAVLVGFEEAIYVDWLTTLMVVRFGRFVNLESSRKNNTEKKECRKGEEKEKKEERKK